MPRPTESPHVPGGVLSCPDTAVVNHRRKAAATTGTQQRHAARKRMLGFNRGWMVTSHCQVGRAIPCGAVVARECVVCFFFLRVGHRRVRFWWDHENPMLSLRQLVVAQCCGFDMVPGSFRF